MPYLRDWLTARAVCGTAILLCACAAAPIAAQDLTILRYEALTDLAAVTGPGSNTGDTQLSVSFSAFGMRFAMTLARNDLLTRNLSPETQQRLAASEFYAGRLDGNAESWVRLTRTEAELSGAIFDGVELYMIEPFGRVAAQVIAGPQVAATDSIIYRWSDTLSVLTDAVASPAVPADAGGSQKPALVPGVFDELSQSKITPAQEISIGLLGDSEYVQILPHGAENYLVSIANTVDGIFYGQLGVRINVAELRTYAEPDAFSGTDPSELLRQVGDFKFNTPTLRGQGVVHLVTGRDLDEHPGAPVGTRLLGVANLGAVCDERYAVSLTQYTNLGIATVAVAHEIAHNFGAPHDAAPGPCESTPEGYIMSPLFSVTDQFSQCSIQQMEARLASATCLTDLSPIDLSVQRLDGPTEVVATHEFSIQFAVDYAGAGDAADARITVTPTNLTGVSVSADSQARCPPGVVPPVTCSFYRLSAAGGRVFFSARFVAPQAGPAYVEIEVSAINDHTPSNNRYRFDFNVEPEGHFELVSFNAPRAVRPNQVFDAEWVVVNAGQIPATNVRAEIYLGNEFEIVETQTPSGAACTQGGTTYPSGWLCPMGTLARGANVPLKAKLRAKPATGVMYSGVSLNMRAAEPVFALAYPWLGYITVSPQIVDVHLDVFGPDSVPVGSSATFTIRVSNRGPDAAGRVNAWLRSYSLRFGSVTSSRGSCAEELALGGYSCQFPSLASGETVDVTVQATVRDTEDVHELRVFGGAVDLYDTDSYNNDESMLIRSVAAAAPPAPTPTPAPAPAPTPDPPPAPPSPAPAASGGGGGGGGVDLMMLLLLLGAAARRSFRAATRKS